MAQAVTTTTKLQLEESGRGFPTVSELCDEMLFAGPLIRRI